MRRLLRDIAEGREMGDVTTLKEPGVMDDLASKFDSEDGDDSKDDGDGKQE
jgi:acetyl-CoA synthetase